MGVRRFAHTTATGACSIVLVVLLSAAPLLQAQVDTTKKKAKSDSARIADSTVLKAKTQQVLAEAHIVRWYEAAAVVGGVIAATAIDQSIAHAVQDNRSNTLSNVASVFRQQGEPWYYATVSLGVFGTGLILKDADIRRAGRRLVFSVAASGVAMAALKFMFSRSRPNDGAGAFSFHPFTDRKDATGLESRQSFPSGHATAAFAIATSLIDDIRNPVASVALYTIAAGAAWSRIYDNRHWFSDTIFGAALGITTAKVVSGHWRVFGWRPPSVLVHPTGEVALQWTVPISSKHVSGQ
jgi:membrane-associated phospholipid phosphatase